MFADKNTYPWKLFMLLTLHALSMRKAIVRQIYVVYRSAQVFLSYTQIPSCGGPTMVHLIWEETENHSVTTC